MNQVRYMLDTNTASYIINNKMPAVRKHLLAVSPEQLCISVITEAELLFGSMRKPENTKPKIAVREFLLMLNILAWDDDAAYHYASLRSSLERSGKIIGNMDMMIAAHALSARVTLVTNDASFRKAKGLSLANWTLP